MNRSVLVVALALLFPAMASGQRLAPGEAPRGVPSEATPSRSGPSLAQDRGRDKEAGGRPSEPATARPSSTPGSTPNKPGSPTDGAPPLRFDVVREGPQEACGKNCRTWVSASGRITPDTARDF